MYRQAKIGRHEDILGIIIEGKVNSNVDKDIQGLKDEKFKP